MNSEQLHKRRERRGKDNNNFSNKNQGDRKTDRFHKNNKDQEGTCNARSAFEGEHSQFNTEVSSNWEQVKKRGRKKYEDRTNSGTNKGWSQQNSIAADNNPEAFGLNYLEINEPFWGEEEGGKTSPDIWDKARNAALSLKMENSKSWTHDASSAKSWSNQRTDKNSWSNQRTDKNSWSNQRTDKNSWSNQRTDKKSWSNQRTDKNSWSNQRTDKNSWSNQRTDKKSWSNQRTDKKSWSNQRTDKKSWANENSSKDWPSQTRAEQPCDKGSTEWPSENTGDNDFDNVSTAWPEFVDDGSRAEQRKKELELIAWKDGYVIRKEAKLARKEKNKLPLIPAELDWDEYYKEQDRRKWLMTDSYPGAPKNLYVEDKAVASMTSSQVSAYRRSLNDITITDLDSKPSEALSPIRTFQEAFNHHQKFLKLILKHGFTKPSPVQCQLWPLIMSGRDVIGIAQTGTGKTLAYLIPGLIHIEKSDYYHLKSRDGPVSLILAPTRELAQQIHKEIGKFSVSNIKTACVYGKGNRDEQLRDMEGCDIIVATPGRLLDFADNDDVNLEGVSYFVLDEADRMLDMGFHADIMRVYNKMRLNRQVILTSATWKYSINFAAKIMMKDPIKVNIGQMDLAAVETVTQKVIVCEEEEKDEMLFEMLRNLSDDDKVIVFVNKKAVADYISMNSYQQNITKIDIMHGGLDQNDRETSLKSLKDGTINILIATDLASRGLDVLDLTKVINLEMPRNMEEYVHRSGRTGRAGKKGEVITFVTWDDRCNIKELIEIMERSDQEIPDELRRMSGRAKRWMENRKSRGGRGRGGRRGRGGTMEYF